MKLVSDDLTLVIIVLILIFIICYKFFSVPLWISALAAGLKINLLTIGRMRLRKINPSVIIYPLIIAYKAGLDISSNQLENHHLADGDVKQVVNGLIAARRTDIDLSFERAAELDLSGQDVLKEVQKQVNLESKKNYCL